MSRNLLILSLLLLLIRCGAPNVVKLDEKSISGKDYPYIEKFHEGVRFKARGQFREAQLQFEQCLLMRQDDDAVYYALSELALIQNNTAKSEEYIQKAADLDPENIWYTQELAYMYLEKGNYDNAIKQFDKLVSNQPNNVEWLYAYAECFQKAGKLAEAIKMLDKTEDQMGEVPELSIQKFRLYLQMKQPDKGIQEIENARKIFPNDPQLLATLVDYYFQTGKEEQAIKMLESLVIAAPENGRAHLALADIYRQQGKEEKVFEELKMAFVCDDVDLDAKMKILINLLESNSKLNSALNELIELLIAKYPNQAKPYSIKGDYLLKLGKTDDALAAFSQAVKYDKKQYPIWKQVMLMHYERTDYAQLYATSKECLTYFPTLPTVFLFNGLSAVQLRKYDEALEVLQMGKDLIVNDKVLEAEFLGQIGEAFFGKQAIDKGKEKYNEALRLDPTSKLLKNNFAFRLALAKVDLDNALTMMDEVLSGVEHVRFIDTRGFILFQQGKYSEAKNAFEKAFAQESKDKLVIEHLGDVSIKLGDKSKAIEYWQKAKSLGSTNQILDKKIDKKEYYDPVY